jgi:hypothetical protein
MKTLIKRNSILIAYNKNNKILLSQIVGSGPKYIKVSALDRSNYCNVDTQSVVSQGLIEYVNSSNPEDKIYITSSVIQSIKDWNDKRTQSSDTPS